ncbi:MAG: hypothetical protein M1834_003823 [Cirrosporium novae-zelandiae]|nr:MAG: hypothetical protein M1834_003823 [Cirrosporium novae-zelandiae]
MKFSRPFQHEEARVKWREDLKNHFVAATGEFVGTFLFLYLAFAGHLMSVDQAVAPAAQGGNANSTVIYISMSYGFALLVTVWGFYRISGGLFNPAVTLGLCLSQQLAWTRAAFLFPAQLLGSMTAAGLVSCMFPGDIGSVNTTLSRNTSIAQGCFIEMFLTSVLVFTVLMLAAEKSKDTFLAPVGIGLALFICEIAGVNSTGGSLNPVRSFGPAVASNFPGYHWIYWVGPCLGSLITSGYYLFVKYFHYEEANPGQDSADGDFRD